MAGGFRKIDKTKGRKCGEEEHGQQVMNKYKILSYI
jgi:hypothetical protein